jgi:hypothetical protein
MTARMGQPAPPEEETHWWHVVDLMEEKLRGWMQMAPRDVDVTLRRYSRGGMDSVLTMKAERLPILFELDMFYGSHVEVRWANLETDEEVRIEGYRTDGDVQIEQVLELVMDRLRSTWS